MNSQAAGIAATSCSFETVFEQVNRPWRHSSCNLIFGQGEGLPKRSHAARVVMFSAKSKSTASEKGQMAKSWAQRTTYGSHLGMPGENLEVADITMEAVKCA